MEPPTSESYGRRWRTSPPTPSGQPRSFAGCEGCSARSGGNTSVETVEHHAGIIEISVRDSGPGVKDIDLERIFEPFVTTKSTGLGMGLSISRSILDAHGGRMWATRNSEHGLTGHIELSHEGRV